MSRRTEVTIEVGGTNVYADLGYPDAAEMQRKSQLAGEIARKVVGELNSEASSELLKVRAQKKVDDIQQKVNDKLRDLLGEEKDDGSAN